MNDNPPDGFEDQPPDGFDNSQQSLLSLGWESLKKPEELSREGLGMMANAVPSVEPTGKMFRDVALNTPKILAESVAEFAPSFVSREAIALGGLGKGLQMASKVPLFQKGASAVGRGVAKTLQKTTGVNAENTRRLFNNPSELFNAPTKKVVSQAYAKSELPQVEQTLEDIVSSGTASYAGKIKLAGKKLLSGSENAKTLLEGRKALDKQIADIDVQIDAAKGSARSALIDAKNDKLNLRSEFNKRLDILAPKLRQADAVASRQLAVDPFRRVFLPGNSHFISPEGILRAVPGVPSAIGLGVSGAGGAMKLLGKAVGAGGQVGETLGSAGDVVENQALLRRRVGSKPLFRKVS